MFRPVKLEVNRVLARPLYQLMNVQERFWRCHGKLPAFAFFAPSREICAQISFEFSPYLRQSFRSFPP
jgi:hypothetical protein